MERKYLIVLIIELIVISTILYGCVNNKNTQELSGVLKAAIGKPSMFGPFYLQKEDGSRVVLDSIIKINLSDYLEQDVTVQGFYEYRTLNCDPTMQCASHEEYAVFVVTGIIESFKIKTTV